MNEDGDGRVRSVHLCPLDGRSTMSERRSLLAVALRRHRHSLKKSRRSSSQCFHRERERRPTFLSDSIVDIVLTFPLSFRRARDGHLPFDDLRWIVIGTGHTYLRTERDHSMRVERSRTRIYFHGCVGTFDDTFYEEAFGANDRSYHCVRDIQMDCFDRCW